VFENYTAAKAAHAGVLKRSASEGEQNQRNSLTHRAPCWGSFLAHRAAPSFPWPHEHVRCRSSLPRWVMCYFA